MDMRAVEVTGTFAGHLYFGVLFTVWGLVWLVEAAASPPAGSPRPFERGVVLPSMKLVFPLVAIWFEIPNRGWQPMNYMMGWAHIAAYLPFAFTGAVDLLARRGAMPARAGYIAYALAMLNAAFVFWSHDHGGGVPHAAHNLLEVGLLTAGALAIFDLVRPSSGSGWFRRGTLFGLGTWLLIVTWVLYRSGWEMADPLREAWVYVLFSWNAIIVTVAVTVTAVVRRGRARETA